MTIISNRQKLHEALKIMQHVMLFCNIWTKAFIFVVRVLKKRDSLALLAGKKLNFGPQVPQYFSFTDQLM